MVLCTSFHIFDLQDQPLNLDYMDSTQNVSVEFNFGSQPVQEQTCFTYRWNCNEGNFEEEE
jgi:hypothetical protein